MNIVGLHELIDKWYQEELNSGEIATGDRPESPATAGPPEDKRELPEGKRAVRTKSQGDKVFYLDDEKKTRQWVTSPEVLASLGFEMGDIVEVDDGELIKYQMASAIYKPVDGKS